MTRVMSFYDDRKWGDRNFLGTVLTTITLLLVIVAPIL